MSKKVLMLIAIVLVFSACKLEAAVTHSTWVGGEEGSWGNASNWDPKIVPNNTGWRSFVVSVTNADVTLQEDRTINQLDCYGEVNLVKGPSSRLEFTLEDPNGLTNHGYLGLSGEGTNNNIVGNLTNISGARLHMMNWLELAGKVQNEKDAQMRVPARCGIWARDGFHNSGEILMGLGECTTSGVFMNKSSGVIRGTGAIVSLSEQPIQNYGRIYAGAGGLVLHSYGTITNTGILGNHPGSTLHVTPSICDVNNQGTIEVNADGSVTADCNFVNESGAEIKLLGGTLAAKSIVQKTGATFKGFGGITGDVISEPNGMVKLTGPTNVVGDVNIPENGTLEISDGTTLITGHTTCNGTIHMKGGQIIPQGGLSGNCNIIWEPGTYTNIADFNLDGQVNFKDFVAFADTWLWQIRWD